MTQTAEKVYYTDYFYSDTSSVIEQVWYDSETKDMYVQLLNGTTCGYSDVKPEVYRAFVGQESAGNSIGAYWNTYIKRGLTGKSTEGLDEYSFYNRSENEEEYDRRENEEENVLVAEAPTERVFVNVIDPEDTNEARVLIAETPVRNEYLIAFEHDGGTGELILYASSIEEALANFDIVRGAARYVNVAINSVTLFFNN